MTKHAIKTIRPSDEVLAKVDYLKKQLGITTLSGVIWYCISYTYRAVTAIS